MLNSVPATKDEIEQSYLQARIRLKEAIAALAMGNAQVLQTRLMAGQGALPDDVFQSLQGILTELEVLNRRLDGDCKPIFGR